MEYTTIKESKNLRLVSFIGTSGSTLFEIHIKTMKRGWVNIIEKDAYPFWCGYDKAEQEYNEWFEEINYPQSKLKGFLIQFNNIHIYKMKNNKIKLHLKYQLAISLVTIASTFIVGSLITVTWYNPFGWIPKWVDFTIQIRALILAYIFIYYFVCYHFINEKIIKK